MPKTRLPYPPKCRREAIRMVRSSGMSISDATRELGVSAEFLRKWVKQTDIVTGEREGRMIDFWAAFSDLVIIVRRLIREG